VRRSARRRTETSYGPVGGWQKVAIMADWAVPDLSAHGKVVALGR